MSSARPLRVAGGRGGRGRSFHQSTAHRGEESAQMLTREENDLVTRVCGDAPLGRMLRKHFWIPAMISQKLVADGAPVRSRLLGEDYVAFRSTDGRVGFLDDVCPHRG